MTSDKPNNAFGIRADRSGEPGNATAGQLHVGDVIEGRYRVVGIIGRGAMGVVYAVDQLFLQKRFALKTLNPLNQIEVDDVLVMRFQKEAKTTSRLDHPNLVRSIDFGMINNQQPFLVMDYVEGQSLAQFLQERGNLPVKLALEIFIPICFGIAYAHQEGVVHRDLKPGNILLAKPEENTASQFIPKVVDFGISKIAEAGETQGLTKTGEVFGTPLYMSPEQCIGTAVDQRSDIYSLGCVMYEALTGTVPFVAATALQTMMGHRELPIPPMKEASLGTEFPIAMEQIIRKMLAKDPKDRYQDCTALAEDLISFQQTGGIQSAHKVTVQRPAKPVDSQPAKSASPLILAGGILFVIGLAGYFAAPQIKSHFGSKGTSPASNNNTSVTPPQSATHPSTPVSAKSPDNPEANHVDPNNRWVPPYGNFRDLNDQSKVIFNFPPDETMGDIYCWKLGKVEIQKALGPNVTFPNASQRILDVSPDFLDNPAFSLYFSKGDLSGLRIGLRVDPGEFDNSLNTLLNDGLKMVSLKWFPISDEVFYRIVHMTNLRWLCCDQSLTAQQLASMPQLRNLSVLEVVNLKSGSIVIKKLQGSTELQRLSLKGSLITAADLAAIAKCRNLVRLDLTNSLAYKEVITNHGDIRQKLLEEVATLPNLQYFAPGILIDQNPQPKDLEPLKKMKELKVLFVNDVQMPQEARESVKQCVNPDCKVFFSSQVAQSDDPSNLLPQDDENTPDKWADFRYTDPDANDLLSQTKHR